MSDPTPPERAPEIVFERSDDLLSGSTVIIRGVGVPDTDSPQLRSAVAVTLQVSAGQCQVSDAGLVTVTLLVAGEEALGIGRWLREAAQSLPEIGPPMFAWPDAP